MNELKIFENPEFGKIRAVEIDGEPWFVAADVCRALEIQNSRDAVTRLDDDEKNTVVLTDGIPGNPNKTIVNEPGLYTLVLGSRKPEAKAFKRWITHEVIPAIRKHGLYATESTIEAMLNDPDMAIRLLLEVKEERAKRKALEVENETQRQIIADFQPIKQYVDKILSSSGTMATTQIAADYDMSARMLNKILREEGIQHNVNGQWILYRKHMGKGYTSSKTVDIIRSNGEQDTKLNTVWTQKGRLMIHEILTRRGVQAVMDRQPA